MRLKKLRRMSWIVLLSLVASAGAQAESPAPSTPRKAPDPRDAAILITPYGVILNQKALEKSKARMKPEDYAQFEARFNATKAKAMEQYKNSHDGQEWTPEAGRKDFLARQKDFHAEQGASRGLASEKGKGANPETAIDGKNIPVLIEFPGAAPEMPAQKKGR